MNRLLQIPSAPAPHQASAHVAALLERLHTAAAQVAKPIALMEVCGTHTMSAFRSGLHSLLPANVTLLSGPGCPVCVTAQSDIDLLIQLSATPGVTLCTYGDMLRVPSRSGSLEQARAHGADVRVIYSTLDAVQIAARSPDRQVVLAAVGFETTAPATAAAVLAAQARKLTNFSVFASHKLVIPAMTALLVGGDVHIDGFLLPGHVSAIIGAKIYFPLVQKFGLPCVVAGFEELHMARAILHLVELIRDHRAELINDYPETVTPDGNTRAVALLNQVFEPSEVRWRALGSIPNSGLVLRAAYSQFNAHKRFSIAPIDDQEVPGCNCGKVITGSVTPHQCKLFGTVCTPINPIGPCMVSSEGTCQAYFKYARVAGRFSGSFPGAAEVRA